MLVYLNTSAEPGAPCPPWLEGIRPGIADYALCHRETGAGHIVGMAKPLLFSPPLRWHTVDDAWKVGRIGTRGTPVNHGILARDILWCDVKPCRDLAENVWMAPVILTQDGDRAFRVAYGANWLPALTPEQERAENIARAARDALAGGGADIAVACQWVAELLCCTYHLHVQCFAAFALIDDALVADVLGAATGLPLGVER